MRTWILNFIQKYAIEIANMLKGHFEEFWVV